MTLYAVCGSFPSIHMCTKRAPWLCAVSRLEWQNASVTEHWPQLHWTPLAWTGNAECAPDLLTQHQLLTSLILMWQNGSIPITVYQNLSRIVAVNNNIKEAIYLELWYSHPHMCVMIRCPHTFVHTAEYHYLFHFPIVHFWIDLFHTYKLGVCEVGINYHFWFHHWNL